VATASSPSLSKFSTTTSTAATPSASPKPQPFSRFAQHIVGTSGLSAAALVALLLAILRRPGSGDVAGRERTARLFLVGLAGQCLHFTEEFVTRFPDRFPPLLGLSAWSESFFVVFNLTWLCIWILSAIGLQRGYWFALFPVWFFAIGSILNGIAHPLLAILVRGYFPGLITSPLVGVLGLLLWLRLQALTSLRL
jgi:hypothetical protein